MTFCKREMKNKLTAALLFLTLFCMSIGQTATALYADESVSSNETSARKKGELVNVGEITLDDANLTLRAALGSIRLTGEQLWAADLLDDGDITLANAQIILCAALGIEPVEDGLLKTVDYAVNHFLSIEAVTDKDAYQVGDEIQVTVHTKNNSEVPIYPFATHSTWGESSCLYFTLRNKAEKMIASMSPDKQITINNAFYYGTLNPGQTLETHRTLYIHADELESGTDGLYLDVEFTYSSDPFGPNNTSPFPKRYKVKVPLDITISQP